VAILRFLGVPAIIIRLTLSPPCLDLVQIAVVNPNSFFFVAGVLFCGQRLFFFFSRYFPSVSDGPSVLHCFPHLFPPLHRVLFVSAPNMLDGLFHFQGPLRHPVFCWGFQRICPFLQFMLTRSTPGAQSNPPFRPDGTRLHPMIGSRDPFFIAFAELELHSQPAS